MSYTLFLCLWSPAPARYWRDSRSTPTGSNAVTVCGWMIHILFAPGGLAFHYQPCTTTEQSPSGLTSFPPTLVQADCTTAIPQRPESTFIPRSIKDRRDNDNPTISPRASISRNAPLAEASNPVLFRPPLATLPQPVLRVFSRVGWESVRKI